MPMKKNSTICILKITEKGHTNLSVDKEIGPKSQTIDFLRNFARSYHVEPELGTALGGYVLN